MTNTDPVLEIFRLRCQAARLESEYGLTGAAENIRDAADKLESALASAPPSAPEPEVHSYDPTDQRESVTIRWPDGECLGYVLDRTRYTDNLPPSAPVGVEWVLELADEYDTKGQHERAYYLRTLAAQQQGGA